MIFTVKSCKDELPEWVSKYVYMGERFEETGLTEVAKEGLALFRGKGYCGLDLCMFLIAYFSSGKKCGLKEFAKDSAKIGGELAGVLDRKRFPTQASVSRGLNAITLEQAEAFANIALGHVKNFVSGVRD